jgi:TldD protein
MNHDIFLPALEHLKKKGVDYADLRFEQEDHQRIQVKNGEVQLVSHGEDRGFGVRVLYNGAFGFAASSIVSEENALRIADRALEIARASTTVSCEPAKLTEENAVTASYRTEVGTDPFDVPLDDKLGLLKETDRRMAEGQAQIREGEMAFFAVDKLFLNSEGSRIDQHILHSGITLTVRAHDGEGMQRRSFIRYAQKGYEYIESMDLPSNAEHIARELDELVRAPECPTGRRDVIIGGEQLALQVHESCGHPVELDRVLGTEAGFYGTSFLTPDKLGSFQYGSNVVNIQADATHPDGLGCFGFDDEGVRGQRSPIVRDGIFVGYLTSRDTAHVIGRRSNGCARASSWNRIPLVRMTSIDLLPGEGTLEDLIADTEDGILVESNKSWSIDFQRLNFQFGTELCWEIKNGKRTRMLRNPVYTGITPEFWNSCDAVCGPEEWQVYGLPGCGKGEPGQGIRVSHGSAPARFRGITVGVKK